MPERNIEAIFEEHKGSLLAISGVVGVAIGKSKGKACIRVFVTRKDTRLLRQVPRSLDGYEVLVDETGEIRALNAENQ